MQLIGPILLATVAFWLGACPFAVWIGKWFLNKNIREYGDHNPGAANVFKAGSIKWGFVAVLLEIGKGIPFVVLANYYLNFSVAAILFVGLCSILGHAFSPMLGFNGGKATAVTTGVFIAVPQKEIIIVFLLIMIVLFFILDGDSWRITLAISGCFVYILLIGGGLWEALFLISVLIILVIKNYDGLRRAPKRKKKIHIGFGKV